MMLVACGTNQPQTTPRVQNTISLEVHNENWQDIRVYPASGLQVGGRLVTVTSFNVATRQRIRLGNGDVSFRITFIGDSRQWVSNQVIAVPGDHLVLVVGNQQSNFFLRKE